MKLNASYVRLSEKDRDLEGVYSESINNQRALIKEYAKNNGFVIDKEYIDDGCSGGNFDRPGFKELLKDIEDGLIKMVITKDMSRLGRNFIDTAYYITEYFALNDIRYIAINDCFDSSKDDSSIKDLMVGIKSLINDKFIKDTSLKVMKAKKESSDKKNFLGVYPPYGYNIEKINGVATLVIDEATAPVVKQIFNDVISGKTVGDVVNKLNDDEVITPMDRLNLKGKKGINYSHKWNTTEVYKIIRNVYYVGNLFYRSSERVDYHNKTKRKKIPVNDRIIIENTHEPIITMKEYNEANNRIKQIKIVNKCNYEGVYKKILYCGECGKQLRATIRKSNNKIDNVFYCHRVVNGKAVCDCNITKPRLDKVIKDIIKDILNNNINKDEMINKIVNKLIKDEKIIAKLSNLQKSIEQNRFLIKNKYIMKAKGEISLEEFKKFKEEKDIIIKRNEELLEKLSTKYDKNKLVELVKEKYQSFSENEEMFELVVNELIEKIILYHDKTIKINFKFKKLDSQTIKLY